MSKDADQDYKKFGLYDSLREFLSPAHEGRDARGIIFTHRQADPDALCAAGALKSLMESSTFGVQVQTSIVVPQGASVLGKQVSSALRIEFTEKSESNFHFDADYMIVVDTGDPKLLEPCETGFLTSKAKKLLIDHHPSSSLPETWGYGIGKYLLSGATSTCEIVALGLPPVSISKKVADMLLTGLLFDSQHLGIATNRTLEAALVLVNAGSEISKSKRMLHHDPDRSEILAKIKGAQRLRYEEAGGRFLVTSEISSYHASVARMLVEIGADVGIAFGETSGEARLSVRCSQPFFKETGIDLSTEVRKVAERYGLVGGGHSTAASISGKTDSKVLADSLLQNLKSRLLQK
jgi:nanoRNase/pAp phosphatase (c-di-AMP/oligoRNAs hydrolase)